MKPVVIIVPLLLITCGVVTFFLLPLSTGLRTVVLVSDLAAAGLLGFLIWRKSES